MVRERAIGYLERETLLMIYTVEVRGYRIYKIS